MEHIATPAWAMLAYLIAGVFFIFALRGLSSPSTSRQGNRFGMAGMLIAVVTTLLLKAPVPEGQFLPAPTPDDLIILAQISGAIAIGAIIGLTTAKRIAMTDMPQLVAAFHSLVGLAAVLVAAAAFLNPDAFGILLPNGTINPVSRVEMGLGIAIGAITFSGSVIAFAKLNGNMSGAPIMLPGRHIINLGTLVAIIGLTAYFTQDQAPWVFWTITALSFIIGFLLIIPIGGADMPVVVSMLNSYSGWAAAAMGFTLHNTAMIITGALVGSSRSGWRRSQSAAPLETRLCRRCGLPAERGRKRHHHPRLRHGGGAGAAHIARNGRRAEEGRRQREIRHPPGCRTYAGPYERAAGRSERAL